MMISIAHKENFQCYPTILASFHTAFFTGAWHCTLLKISTAKTPAWTSKCPCKERCKFGRIWYVKYLPSNTRHDVIVKCRSKKPKSTKPVMFSETGWLKNKSRDFHQQGVEVRENTMVMSKYVTANRGAHTLPATNHRLNCKTLQLVQHWKCASVTRTMICCLHCHLT